jgi:hypothetical protein
MSVFMFMMVNAGERRPNATERGELFNWSDEDTAAALDIDPQHVTCIREAMQGKTLDGDKLPGWEKRQPIRDDGSAERAREWRERNRTQANAGKRPDIDTDTDKKEKENTRERVSLPLAEFENEFWPMFPNKVGKGAARKAWRTAVGNATVLEIMAGLRRYVAKTDDRPWCNPSTWLNQDRWLDQPATVGNGQPGTEVELIWIQPDTPHWEFLLNSGKRESFLRSQLRKSPDGIEALPMARSQLQGAPA